jgi:hypothetical protein
MVGCGTDMPSLVIVEMNCGSVESACAGASAQQRERDGGRQQNRYSSAGR